jgi:hypothetical protein
MPAMKGLDEGFVCGTLHLRCAAAGSTFVQREIILRRTKSALSHYALNRT